MPHHSVSLSLFSLLVVMVLSGIAPRSASGKDSVPSPTMETGPELRLTIREAMDAALDNNPNVRLFKEKIQAARANTFTQLGAMLPNLSSSVHQYQATIFLGTIGLSPVRTNDFSIFDARTTLSQSLFSFSLLQRWQASREALKVAELEAVSTNADTMAKTALVYVEAQKADELVRAREANVKLFGELLDLIRSRRGGGMATGLDTERLEAQMANVRQQLAAVRYEVARLHANLLNLLGIVDPVKLVLTDALKQDAGDMPRFEEAVGVAFGERPEVKAQAQRIKTANLALRSTVSERLPSLTGQGDYGLIGNRYNNTLDTYNVGVFLNVPLFDGGQREGRIKEARSQMRQEAIRLDVVKQQVMLDVREALVTLASAKEQFAIAQDGVRAALSELDLAADRFRQLSGATTLEVTNAMFNLSRARENAVEALFRLNASRVNLSRGLGLMNEFR